MKLLEIKLLKLIFYELLQITIYKCNLKQSQTFLIMTF